MSTTALRVFKRRTLRDSNRGTFLKSLSALIALSVLVLVGTGISKNALAQTTVTGFAIGCENFASAFDENRTEAQNLEAKRHSKVNSAFLSSWGSALFQAQALGTSTIKNCSNPALASGLATLKSDRKEIVAANIKKLPTYRAQLKDVTRKHDCLESAGRPVLYVDSTQLQDLIRTCAIVKVYDVCIAGTPANKIATEVLTQFRNDCIKKFEPAPKK